MNIKVDSDVLNFTVNCKTGFSCLSGKKRCLCKVRCCIADELYFIEYAGERACHYKEAFADSFVCTCPTRKEIYNKYTY